MVGRLRIVAVVCAVVAGGCLMAIRMRRQELGLRRSLNATDKRLALVSLVACAVIVVLVVFGYVP